MRPTPEEENALAQGRMRAIRLAPYFSDAVYALVPWSAAGKLPPGVGTAVTSTGVLLYEPSVILNEWSIEDMATGYLHEAEHVYRDHAGRAPADCDRERWNVCCDAELADDLKAMGCQLLDTDILPATLGQADGRTAEHYYHDSEERHKRRPCLLPRGRGACGSGSGNPLPGEAGIELPPLPPAREVHLEAMRHDVSHAIQQAAAGTVPGALRRFSAERVRAAEIPWETKLAVLARRAVAWRRGNLSSTYSQTNRRQGGLGFGPGRPVLAAPVSPTPNVCLVQDTSGSLGKEDIAYTLTQAAPILRAAGGRVTFIAIDAKVHTLRQVSRVSEIRRSLAGGGGTDFRPAFDALAKLRNRPDVVVFSTDGYGNFPERRPSWCQVIWLLQCRFGEPNKVPWGASIVIPKARPNAQGIRTR